MTPPLPSNPRPTQALVLAAGLGTRLDPLTRHRPKALLPLWDQPLLAYALVRLRDWGVQRALVNVHHHAAAVIEYLRTHPLPGLEVAVSHEPHLLGTGGALIRARWFFTSGPFWMLNADVLASLDPVPLLEAAQRTGAPATVWTDRRRGPRTVALTEGRVKTFTADHPGAPGTATLCGLHLFQDELWHHVPRRETFCSLLDILEPFRKCGQIQAVDPPGALWSDLGTPDRLREAHGLIARHVQRDPVWRSLAGPAIQRQRHSQAADASWRSIAPSAEVHPRAAVRASVISAGVRLGPRADVRDALVAPHLHLNTRASHLVARAEDLLAPAEQRALIRAGLLPPGTLAEALPRRGSDRQFIRLLAPAPPSMVVRIGRGRPENKRLPGLTQGLTDAGLPVPALRLHHPRLRLQVYVDGGHETLLDRVRERGPAACHRDYEQVLEALTRFHHDGLLAVQKRRVRLMKPFGPALYAWEHAYFLDHFATPLLAPGAALLETARRALAQIATRLRHLPPVLLHRDAQSSNVLLPVGGPLFVDIQGARRGPALYDVASLLYDPYAALPEAMIHRLASDLRAPPPSLATAALQRLTQALGAFARLHRLTGSDSYRQLLAPTLRQWSSLLTAVDAPRPLFDLAHRLDHQLATREDASLI